MPLTETGLPRKTRELTTRTLDSTIWNDFVFRDDDIVIATYAKSGTTWTQQIVAQLLFKGDEDVIASGMSPWLDMGFRPREEKLAILEAQTHRRFIKTHLPVDALVFSPKAKYVYIGRDGRDVVWSLYNHHANCNDRFYETLNTMPGPLGPHFPRPVNSIRDYFVQWLERDCYPWWSYWDNVRSWWEVRHLPNVLMVHYANLKADMPGEIRRIADFLGIPVDEKQWPAILEHCSFDYMKTHAARTLPNFEVVFEGGAKSFIYKGSNGRWKDVLSADDCRRYETKARQELGEACAHWISTGDFVTG